MNILITGGAGFLGSHLTEALMEDNNITVVDNLITGRYDNVPKHDNVTFLGVDIVHQRKDLVKTFMQYKPDVVIHAAGSYKDPDDWTEDILTNIEGTANVVRLCEEHSVKRLIYFQTSLCYGLHPDDSPLQPNSEVRPEGSSYAITKTAGEQIIRMGKVPYISFRLANVMGPRNLSGPVPTFFQRLKAGKPCFVMDTRRDFIFVDDLVRVVVQAVNGTGEDNWIYHISTGHDYSIKELYDAVVDAMVLSDLEDVEVRTPHPDDAPTLLIDPSATEKDFHPWKADTDLHFAIAKAVNWYENKEFGETFTHLKDVKGE